MVEWSITAVLKTVELKGSGGSNPSLSAKLDYQGVSIAKAMLISFLASYERKLAFGRDWTETK